MKMEHMLVGKRIKIILDDDGTGKPPDLPPGTVIRSLVGTDRVCRKCASPHCDRSQI